MFSVMILMKPAQRGLQLVLSLSIITAQVLRAELIFSLSHSKQCVPLNITWTPVAANFPYTVTLGAVGNGVTSYRIPSNYQPGASELTFQYVVPPATGLFNSFIVAVTDAVGNGNSSRIIGIDGRNASTLCDPYRETLAFVWAGDSQVDSLTNMVQCGDIKFYPVDDRGTSPYAITMIPLGGLPRTFSVPPESAPRSNFFNYTLKVPFPAGTQFYTLLSDAKGTGSGGGSPIYTVGQSNDTSCLGKVLPNELRNLAIPTGPVTASFMNLPGALTEAEAKAQASPSRTKLSSGSRGVAGETGGDGGTVGGSSSSKRAHNSLLEGGIGAGVGVSVVLSGLVGWLLLRRRQKMLREVARKEEPTFVDLDGDDYATNLMSSRRSRASRGVSQSYQVSPYTHGSQSSAPEEVRQISRPPLSALDTSSTFGYPVSSPSRPLSTISQVSPASPSAQTALRSVPPSSSPMEARYPPSRPWSSSGVTDTNQSTFYPHATSEVDHNGNTLGRSSGPGSAGHGGYRLQARNGETLDVPPVPSVPQQLQQSAKRPLPARPDTADSRRSQRVVQHSDAGPLPAPSSDDGNEEAVVELPPSYAPDWSDRNPHAA